MKKLLLAALTMACACNAVVSETEPDDESCDISSPEISLPSGCWEEPGCAPENEQERMCGRAYVCEYEQPDGSNAPMCVVAQDCDCLRELDETCDLEVSYLPACRL